MRQTTLSASLSDRPEVTLEELQLAVRNHSMPLEALRYDITPVGLHYLLTHFDIPAVDVSTWKLAVGGEVDHPLALDLEQITSRTATTVAVTLECAGNGRARLSPRPLSQPWLGEGVGNSEWTGTPLGPLLEEAGIARSATHVVFTGLDRGIQGGIDQQYERSLSVADATRDEVMLVYAINGQPLPPQHGFPLRVIVPGWYGMTQVKWLRSITVVNRAFEGYQQAVKYQVRSSSDAEAIPVTRMLPRALMVPPGVPDYMSRTRFVDVGTHTIEGRAWSGHGPVVRVELSDDGGSSWSAAELEDADSPFAWRRWTWRWAAVAGEHELCARAADAAGNVQPADQSWNVEGVQNNAVQRIKVVVGAPPDGVQRPADEP
ncbi:MAG TPA: sulfite oxidase [Candidatus Dormibacteraeota bacterium]|jgi:DMSO/TMAO reductase YedYZ molybdopterin-dependent catalytic subunit